jgi:predicted DNA-binding protein
VATRRKPNSSDRLKKIPHPLYLDVEQSDALNALSAKTGVPKQRYLREGLDLVLKKNGVKLKAVSK